jgi:Ca2+-binding RTX toxin-like protein
MEEGADRTSFFDTDLGTSATALSDQTTLGNLQDGNWHSAQVTWDADIRTLTYRVDGMLGGTLTGDLAQQYFGGSDLVHFGFTGSTGETANVQLVQVTELDANLWGIERGTDAGHDHVEALGPIDGIIITGSPDNDTVVGTPGDDTLIGGLGADSLTGGSGGDHFAYRLAVEGGDTIIDFAIAEDSLRFSATGFGGGLSAGQQLIAGTNFVADANPTATTGAGTFLFNTETNDLAWDFDGSGGGEALHIAHFDTPVSLAINHFEITA